MDIESQKEAYVEQAVMVELGRIGEPNESDRAVRIRFWQSQGDADRMRAVTEINRRVYLARGGSQDNFKVKKEFVRIVRV
ncbi:MAG: hypothetical protein DMF62_12965 [Acidobacteria bacterium]|nr:MAG: hypothetical protein DMF62_12965 [Acidobacteriota bacterium]